MLSQKRQTRQLTCLSGYLCGSINRIAVSTQGPRAISKNLLFEIESTTLANWSKYFSAALTSNDWATNACLRSLKVVTFLLEISVTRLVQLVSIKRINDYPVKASKQLSASCWFSHTLAIDRSSRARMLKCLRTRTFGQLDHRVPTGQSGRLSIRLAYSIEGYLRHSHVTRLPAHTLPGLMIVSEQQWLRPSRHIDLRGQCMAEGCC